MKNNSYKIVCKLKDCYESEVISVSEVYVKNINESILIVENDIVIFYKNMNSDFSNDYNINIKVVFCLSSLYII